ncbi:MAG: hypothetical protein M3Y39_13385 [Chloroflexota bacterium]|nr:hypothetical protein [Chloroflexota bacterium]
MSTSEFDGLEDEKALSLQARDLPDDFSHEDVAFAQELGSLFTLHDEEIPPYFAQTLLEPENPRFQPVERGFEQKTYARVFRRLKLRRRLFRSSKPLRRSMLAVVAACLLFMFATMVATGNSFAEGMAILLSGSHSGVLQVASYPQSLASSSRAVQKTPDPQTKQISLLDVEQQLAFSMYWPQSLPDNYALSGVSLFNDPDQLWAQGPIVQLSYEYMLPGVKPHGNGRIAIREFKPTGRVLQVVQPGAAHQIEINSNGQGQVAIYVDGQWGQTTKVSQAWVFGTRSELIYEHDGIVFWIVGDQRDSINNAVLQNIASSMRPFNMSRALHMGDGLNALVAYDDSRWLFTGDVVYQDGPNGGSWSDVGQWPASSPRAPTHLK